MTPKLSIIALSALVCMAAMSSTALACACCADRGTYSVSTGRLAAYELELLKDMKFGPAAEIFTTEAGFDEMKGIAEVIKEFEQEVMAEFSLVDAFTGESWTLIFKTRGGKVGTLTLPRPPKMTTRRVDIPDNASTSPNVVLYKEWIFNGSVGSGSGFFRRDVVRPSTKYKLLFQGHGNNCDNAEDFTNWRLEINGPRADYAFFGKMKAAAG